MLVALSLAVCSICLPAQDSSSGALRVIVQDPTGARVEQPHVVVVNEGTEVEYTAAEVDTGVFIASMLPPGKYRVVADAPRMSREVRQFITVNVGGESVVTITLKIMSAPETVTVTDNPSVIETQPSAVSALIDAPAIEDLPMNGRRFADLAMLSPGVTADPRGLTSATNGDLAFGGIRGHQSSYLVDGADNNNGFFAQARGRYRAPYQFSNEVVQEFRVSSNTYGAELGRAGGAVVNVVTKSGSNNTHGRLFYYLRDSTFAARHPYTPEKPASRQHQGGFSVGGPIVKNRAFYFAGFDQHVFRIPVLVRFVDGSTRVVPTERDYDANDKALVESAAERLSKLAGTHKASLLGNAAFFKADWNLSARHHVSARVSSSRAWGENNVFFDPASPVTTFATSDNGEERVHTESMWAAWTSGVSTRMTSKLRVQFSRDYEDSFANSEDVRVRIDGLIDGYGRSSILPRSTHERRTTVAETMTLDGAVHRWKFGGDWLHTSAENVFPLLFGGMYIFDDIRVNQWTYEPQTYGLKLTPLRAYAHGVSRYYSQNFGSAANAPATNEYSVFAQDTIRVTDRLALTLGLRYDRQTFGAPARELAPMWPRAGAMPADSNNVAPRAAFAFSLGDERPFVIRGGYGLFYTRIPGIYQSAVMTENGADRSHLFLSNAEFYDRPLFPSYPEALIACPPGTALCAPPASVTQRLETQVSAFADNFRTPYVQQASLGVEREIARRFAVSANYMYTHGLHLIRARDANLPEPRIVSYPVLNENDEFTGEYYDVASFAGWTTTANTACAFPPCLDSVIRPVPELGAVNLFETAASSVYHGVTLSARRQMTGGLYFRAAFTWAKAIDDGQDALVAGRPSTVQNAWDTQSERGLSVTDQRHRFTGSWIWEPRLFHADRPLLKAVFGNWKMSGSVSVGSGRPVNARSIGDANLDGNDTNDRLPGARRNSYTGPNYATTDLRLARKMYITERWRLELMAESFNLFNRLNRKFDSNDDGFLGGAVKFVRDDRVASGTRYPAHFRKTAGWMQPNNAYASRQVQFAVRLSF